MSPTPPPRPTGLQTTLGLLSLLSMTAMLAGALYNWRLRCEGFGCTGVGIVWFMWVCACVPTLGLSWLLRGWLPQGSRLRACLVLALRVLAGVSLALAVYWLLKGRH